MASTTSSGAATPRSKLDVLSREDLVRFVKKQVQNLQAAKQKIDALEARIAEVPAVGEDGERLQEENDRLRAELEVLRQANIEQTAESNANDAEVDRLRALVQAGEQTAARVTTLEEELQRLLNSNKELEHDKEAAAEEEGRRSARLEQLSAALGASEERIRLFDAQLEDAEAQKQRLLERISSFESEIAEKSQSVVGLQEECQLLRTALNERGEICDEIQEENERLVAELEAAHRIARDAAEQSKKDSDELQRQLAEAREHIQRLVGVPVEEKPMVITADRAISTEDDGDALAFPPTSDADAKSQHPEDEDATKKEEEMSSLIVRLQTRVAELEAERSHPLSSDHQCKNQTNVDERLVELATEGNVADRDEDRASELANCKNEFEAERVQLQLTVSQSQEECAKLNADLISMRSELDERQEAIGRLNAEINVLKDQLRDQLASVQNELSIARSELVNTQANHEAELKAARETVELLTSENNQLCCDADALREKLADLAKTTDAHDDYAQTDVPAETKESVADAEVAQENAETETAFLRTQLAEQEEHVKSLRTELDGVKQLLREQSSLVDQVTTQCEQRQAEIERLRKEAVMYKEQLDSIKEKASTQNVLSLEMADYERSVERLQEELKRSQELVQSKTNESISIKKELDALRSQKAKTESNLAKLKTAFVKTRSELTTAQTELEKKTAECDGLNDKLQEVTADVENTKMELSSSMAGEQQRLVQLENTVSSLQRQLLTVHNQRDSLQRQYDDVTTEFETFKTRAHSVLKQQNKTSSEQEQAEEERARLNKMITDLEKRLQETSVGYRTAQEELAAVQDDYERVSERFRRAQTETDEKLAALQRQLASQRADYEARLINESAVVDRLQTRQRDIDKEHALTIDKLREAHVREMTEMREQLATAEAALVRQEKAAESSDDAPNTSIPPVTERAPAEGQEAVSAAPLLQRHLHVGHRRLQRSTMDSDDISGRVSRNSIPLEELLMGDDLSVTSTMMSPTEDMKDAWSLKTEKAMRQLEHTTELLHESEATNARLVDQTKLLKDEIRRLERNKEREQHVANCEYLKNVVMKFLAPQEKVYDERPQLIPILTTMLRLGPDEVELLNKVSNSGDAGQQASGWGGYLHRWSGLT